MLKAGKPLLSVAKPLLNVAKPVLSAAKPVLGVAKPLLKAPNPFLNTRNAILKGPKNWTNAICIKSRNAFFFKPSGDKSDALNQFSMVPMPIFCHF